MIYRGRWVIELSEHTIERAFLRDITIDKIASTVINGKMKWFAKNNVRFINEYKQGKVICVGKIKFANVIKIFTVEWGRK